MEHQDQYIIVACLLGRDQFQLKAPNLTTYLDAIYLSQRIEVQVVQAQGDYQSLSGLTVYAYPNGNGTVTIDTSQHGRIILCQSGFIFPKRDP